jgi:Zn-finger nucleic acid-binding protein
MEGHRLHIGNRHGKFATGPEGFMPENSDDRSGSLKEDYFKRKKEEAIEKLRARMKVADEAKAAGLSTMQCPRCDGDLKEHKFEQVMIDMCEKCGGIWLDSGELDQLLKRDNDSWFSRLWFAEG